MHDFPTDLTRILKKPPADPKLGDPQTPTAIRQKTGLERERSGKVKGKEVTATSTDGLFTFVVQVIEV